MSVLVIRAHKRFAVCSKVRLRKEGRRGMDGLLIELSLDGCRISHAQAASRFTIGDSLTLRVAGMGPIEVHVRWVGDGVVGLRFDRPFHIAALEKLILQCRSTAPAPVAIRPATPELRAYGT